MLQWSWKNYGQIYKYIKIYYFIIIIIIIIIIYVSTQSLKDASIHFLIAIMLFALFWAHPPLSVLSPVPDLCLMSWEHFSRSLQAPLCEPTIV